MKLGLYEYNALPEASKAHLLWLEGTYLMHRFEDNYKINLYSLFDFYVEAWYSPNKNEIEKFRTFKSLNALTPYTDQITLNIDFGQQ
jgi:hypothetical protein